MSDVGVVCEQDGVVGHHRLTCRENATCNVAHTVQNAVVNQEVIDQQLNRQGMSAEVQPCQNMDVKASRDAYAKFLYASLWRL